jgi:membrane protein required for colicin V production
MNELDYGILLLMVLSIVVGVVRGAIREVMNVVGWVLAFILAHTYSSEVAPLLSDWLSEPSARAIVAWALVFIVVVVVVAVTASLLSDLVRKLGLGPLDRLVGGAVGVLRGAIIILALTLAAGLTKLPQSATWREAFLAPWIEVAALYAKGVLPEKIATRIRYRVPPAPPAKASVAAIVVSTAPNITA